MGQCVDVSVSRATDADVPVVKVSGEVDVYSAPALKEQLTGLLTSGASSVVVDLTDVAFLDSTGLGALVEARAATSEAGGSLPLVCNQDRILKLFKITGLDGVFAIHRTVDEALAGLAAERSRRAERSSPGRGVPASSRCAVLLARRAPGPALT